MSQSCFLNVVQSFRQRCSKFSFTASDLTPLVYLLLLVHLIAWSVLTGWSHSAPDLDNNEELVWGSVLEWGYYKHPPLPSWLIHGLMLVLGKSVWMTFFAGQLCVVLSLWIVWKWGCEVTTQRRALVAMLLLSLIAYFTTRGVIYNHNTVQLWSIAGALWMFYRASRTHRVSSWIGLGIFSGLAMLTKYSALVQFATFFLYLAFTGRLREGRIWRGMGVAACVWGVIMAPHIVWLLGQQGGPIQYAEHSLVSTVTRLEHIGVLVDFAVTNFARVVPMLVAIGMIYAWQKWVPTSVRHENNHARFIVEELQTTDRFFIAFMAWVPFALTLTGIIWLKAPFVSGWVTTFFLPFGFFAFWLLRTGDEVVLLRRTVIIVMTIQILSAVGYGVARGPIASAVGRATRSDFPGARIATVMQQRWSEHVPSPMRYVAADTWLGGNITTHLKGNAQVLIEGDFALSPWVDPTTVQECGMLVTVNRSLDSSDGVPPKVLAWMNQATWRGTEQLPWTKKSDGPQVVVEWGIIAPHARCEKKNIGLKSILP